MVGMTEQVLVDRAEEVDKDKKKKRRSNRRSKNNSCSASPSAASGTLNSSGNGTHREGTELLEYANGSSNASTLLNSSLSQNCKLDNHASSSNGDLSQSENAGFSSLPTIRIREEAEELGSMNDQCQSPIVLLDTMFSKSCPLPVFPGQANGSPPLNTNSPSQINGRDADMRRTYFVPYWSDDAVNEAIQKGDIFVASFRVNAYNRLEAYCTIEGLPTDVLISGVASQNRAVEGDTVAVKLDSLAFWPRMKGSGGNVSNCSQLEGSNLHHKVVGMCADNCKGKEKVDDYGETSIRTPSDSASSNFDHDPSKPMGKIRALMSLYPFKRPTGTVVSIIQKSRRRDTVVGFLAVNEWLSHREGYNYEVKKKRNFESYASQEFIQLIPNDGKFPKMLVSLRKLPNCIKKRLMEGDATLEMELVAARIEEWREDNLLPHALVMHAFGRGGEIKPQVAAILFENAICVTEFSAESLSCLPKIPWEVPVEELERRKDLRNLCTFTIDPSTATDLDDALSVERVSDGIFRVGVHIADVSYFVLPDTPLDIEARTRSTSVYLREHRLRMLPPLLSENLGSLVPGVDRLAFSVMFDCNLVGDVVDRWVGRSVIRSCCQLSYQHAQDIIEGKMVVNENDDFVGQCPELYGQFGWEDVFGSVKNLYEISKRLKENRFKGGAIRLENSKPLFLLDEDGIPYESMLSEQTDSNYLIEEFMLLTNRTVAEIISRAYPESALLRRHPEPNERKLKEFEAFCSKHGLELDTSTSGQFSFSLEKIREKLKDDPVFFDILVSFASRPMQVAMYFCTGDFRDRENEWKHYALAMPLYTHFTSPLRRYADILVHRTLSAAIEAEESLLLQQRMIPETCNKEEMMTKCFSGLYFDITIVKSRECKEALASAALKHKVPCTETVAEAAAYCNEKRLASRHAEDAGEKLYLWALLKKKKTLITEARVLGLGPKFMSIYIHKLAIERRINYDEVEGLTAEWLETTSSVVLNLCTSRRNWRRGSPSKFRPLEDVAWVINPCNLEADQAVYTDDGNEVDTTQEAGSEGGLINHSGMQAIEPAVFPLTVRILSTINVVLHAIGGDDGPLDIGARLYMCSYLR